jgi:CBS domain-containing protein
MSPRAAARLAGIGFARVFDYVAGKADWGSAGLPLEGDDPSTHRAGAHARTDVPTCGPGERLPDVRARVEEAGWQVCYVVDEHSVLLGRLGRRALDRDDDVTAEEAMTPGPSTIRPSARLAPLLERLHARNLHGLPITTSDGRLVGYLARDELDTGLLADSAARSRDSGGQSGS